MATKKPKNTMTREEARALYEDLKRRMTESVEGKGEPLSKDQKAAGALIAEEIRKALRGDKPGAAPTAKRAAPDFTPPRINVPKLPMNRGNVAAVTFVLVFSCLKIAWAGLEAAGIATATTAQATMMNMGRTAAGISLPGSFSKEEVRVLTSLDARRAELEERSKKIDGRSEELDRKEREFATKLNEIRELTDKLKTEREKDSKKKNGQLDQLANVYGSMSPQEAAQLIEQLDVTIALQLIERMPEKRVGQILALMSPQRALSITRMLSGKADSAQ